MGVPGGCQGYLEESRFVSGVLMGIAGVNKSRSPNKVTRGRAIRAEGEGWGSQDWSLGESPEPG